MRFRKPLLDRVITVTGPGIREPKNLRVPIGTLTAVCGVSGGGKSSLVTGTLFPAMERLLGRAIPMDEVAEAVVLRFERVFGVPATTSK